MTLVSGFPRFLLVHRGSFALELLLDLTCASLFAFPPVVDAVVPWLTGGLSGRTNWIALIFPGYLAHWLLIRALRRASVREYFLMSASRQAAPTDSGVQSAILQESAPESAIYSSGPLGPDTVNNQADRTPFSVWIAVFFYACLAGVSIAYLRVPFAISIVAIIGGLLVPAFLKAHRGAAIASVILCVCWITAQTFLLCVGLFLSLRSGRIPNLLGASPVWYLTYITAFVMAVGLRRPSALRYFRFQCSKCGSCSTTQAKSLLLLARTHMCLSCGHIRA